MNKARAHTKRKINLTNLSKAQIALLADMYEMEGPKSGKFYRDLGNSPVSLDSLAKRGLVYCWSWGGSVLRSSYTINASGREAVMAHVPKQ